MLIALITGAIMLSSGGLLLAEDPLKQACDQTSSGSTICDVDGKDPITGADGNGVLLKAASIIALVAGVAAVIIIIYAGMQYVLSGGDAQKTQSAKNTIMYAVIGLVVIALSSTIVSFIVTKV
jgi:hypothetical protein